MLAKKKILLGVTGSIAAYKAAFLTRLLIKEEAEVKIILTASASSFITPLTLSTLSKNPVVTDFVKNESGEWNNHVDLGLWADVMIIAPASANTLARCAYGLCNNLLTAVYLSAKCPVFFAPAMDLDMYRHPSTLNNLKLLASFGNRIIQAQFGELASGLVGEGRMAEPEQIVSILHDFFAHGQPLKGKKVLITAGPTYEAIDPVRFIGNHSSGKMGFALAECAASFGAEVVLISGPSHLKTDNPGIQLRRVVSAQEMFEQAIKYFQDSEVIILAAAVADYTPKFRADQKIKKKEAVFSLELEKTIDIAATLGQQKQENQLMIGFALETENEHENAVKKLQSKNLDLIVLNSLRDEGAGFGYDTNQVTLIDKRQIHVKLSLRSKIEIAQSIMDWVTDQVK
jgi:phosphopantothenoylcysteine decarboxylase/phosphopantothenate--cysteine ligase